MLFLILVLFSLSFVCEHTHDFTLRKYHVDTWHSLAKKKEHDYSPPVLAATCKYSCSFRTKWLKLMFHNKCNWIPAFKNFKYTNHGVIVVWVNTKIILSHTIYLQYLLVQPELWVSVNTNTHPSTHVRLTLITLNRTAPPPHTKKEDEIGCWH